MAFPQVAGTAISNTPTTTTTHIVSLPADINPGDLLFIFFVTDGEPTVTTPTGWTLLASGGDIHTTNIYWRNADGEEGATVTITTSAGERSSHASWKITGAADPSSTPPEVSTDSIGNSVSPNPNSLTPTGGAKDYLWIAILGADALRTISVYPYADNQLFSTTDSPFGTITGICSDEINAVSEDPGAFTIDVSSRWSSWTVAVHPEAVEPPEVTNPKIKVSGTFSTKTIKTKISNTFTEKPLMVKVGGAFQ